MNYISGMDIVLYEAFQIHASRPWLDALMVIWRNPWFWLPLYVFLVFKLFLSSEVYKPWLIFVLLVGSLITVDLISSKVLKPLVARERPCWQADVLTVPELLPCGGKNSFPSNHAWNHMHLVVFLSIVWPSPYIWVRLGAVLWAVSIGIAQVYVGKHFFGDIAAGIVLGTSSGLLTAILYRRIIFKRRT